MCEANESKRLDMNAALEMIRLARMDVSKHPELRYGQALWNRLPKHLTDRFVAGENDFFHIQDQSRVDEIFFTHFVIS